jgi:hypothetical protein
MVGFGLTSIFMQGFNYLLDSYLNLYVFPLIYPIVPLRLTQYPVLPPPSPQTP